jgi:ParB family chromosome partitioning protein
MLPLAAAPPASTSELADLVQHEEPSTSRPLDSIRPHPSPSRALDPRHVLDMARSIAALGLIHPLAVDLDGVVLAGSHRLAALRVLAASPDARADLLYSLCAHAPAATLDALGPTVATLPHPVPAVSFGAIPVRVMPLRLSESPDEAWRVEVAENERRRDYKASEVRAIAERLKAQGYRLASGGSGQDMRALPILTALVGRSERQVRRMLADAQPSRTDGREQYEADRQAAVRALEKFRRRYGSGLGAAQVKALRQALDVLDGLAQ